MFPPMARQTKLIDIPIFTTAMTAAEKADDPFAPPGFSKRGGVGFDWFFSGFSFFSFFHPFRSYYGYMDVA